RPRLEESTYRDYRINIERRLKPYFGDAKLSAITQADVRAFVSELAAGVAPGARVPARRIGRARLAAEQLGPFTIADLASALGVGPDTARKLADKLLGEGTIERTHEERRAGRGRGHRVYAFKALPSQRPLRDGERGVGGKTINNCIAVLRVALGHAQEDGLIAANPAASTPGSRDRIKLPSEHREMDFLRLNEIQTYLEACSPGYRPLAEVLIACGLRISEALALLWPHVDFDGSALLVLGSRKRGRDGGEVSGSTKGDRYRSVEFGPRIAGILRDLRARQAEYGLADPARSHVFTGPRGMALNRSDISRGHHKAALRNAGLRESLRLHDLRHTAAASWLAVGLPLIYVQRQLGHSSITTTERQYGHLEKSFLHDAAQRAEAAIWEPRLEAPQQAAAHPDGRF
ncbi:MAG TPA: tyrosine-type recombinase/integrase, partial [Thermoleophilaceae bacterium]